MARDSNRQAESDPIPDQWDQEIRSLQFEINQSLDRIENIRKRMKFLGESSAQRRAYNLYVKAGRTRDVPTFNPNGAFRELGDKPNGEADYVEQNGVVYAWSESNVQYEVAWWLIEYKHGSNTEHVKNLLRDRPFSNWELIK